MFTKHAIIGVSAAALIALGLSGCAGTDAPAGDVDAATATSAEIGRAHV